MIAFFVLDIPEDGAAGPEATLVRPYTYTLDAYQWQPPLQSFQYIVNAT